MTPTKPAVWNRIGAPTIAALSLPLLILLSAAAACSKREPRPAPDEAPAAAPDAAPDIDPDALGIGGVYDPVLKRRVNQKAPPLPPIPDPVATVDGEPIPRVEFGDALIRKFEGQTFAVLTLVWSEAFRDSLARRNLKVTDSEIDAAIQAIVEEWRLPDVNGLLKLKAFDLPYLRRQVEYRIACEKLAIAEGLSSSAADVNTTDARYIDIVDRENEVKLRADGIPEDCFAVVNGRKVLQSEMLARAMLYNGPDEAAKVLDQLIGEKIDEQEVKRAGIDILEVDSFSAGKLERKTIAELVEQNRATFEARGANWAKVLARKGQTVEDWIANVKRTEGVKALIKREHTEDMLRRYFEENKDMLLLGERFRVAVLLVEAAALRGAGDESKDASMARAKARCEEAKAAIDGGLPWEEAVRKYGTSASLAANAGHIGWLNLYQRDKAAIRDHAVNLELSGVSEPFEHQSAWHLVKLLEKAPAWDYARLKSEGEHWRRVLDRMATYGQALWRDPLKRRKKIVVHVDLPLGYGEKSAR